MKSTTYEPASPHVSCEGTADPVSQIGGYMEICQGGMDIYFHGVCRGCFLNDFNDLCIEWLTCLPVIPLCFPLYPPIVVYIKELVHSNALT